MSTLSTPFRATPATAHVPSDLGVPPWVRHLVGSSGADETSSFKLVTVRKNGAASLDPNSFEVCTHDAYSQIAAELRDCATRHPVRFWNYIPDIHRPSGDGLDRYMCFNA